MKSESSFNRALESVVPSSTDKQRYHLQRYQQLNYRQAIGNLIYAMVTCSPDISFSFTKLSQYSINPAAEHYEAIKEVLYYLRCTKNEGIIYWRSHKKTNLPPSITSEKTEASDLESKLHYFVSILKDTVDADWLGGTTHSFSVSDFVLKLSGGAIYYKTRFQPTISLSFIEAGFTATTEAR